LEQFAGVTARFGWKTENSKWRVATILDYRHCCRTLTIFFNISFRFTSFASKMSLSHFCLIIVMSMRQHCLPIVFVCRNFYHTCLGVIMVYFRFYVKHFFALPYSRYYDSYSLSLHVIG